MKREFQVISPVDGSVFLRRKMAEDSTIEMTLERAVEARVQWIQTPLSIRKEICQRALAYFLKHANKIGEEISWQMGRPIRFSPGEITGGFKERVTSLTENSDEALAELSTPTQAGFKKFIRRDPLGTVLVLAPWNYPYLTSANSIFPALLAGNTVILKHAQQTPLCAERYAAAFDHAGLPQGVFQYLHVSHQQVAKIIGDRRIDHVAFTGSVEGGRAIQRAIGERFIHAGLELGGKDPAYVRADANLANAIENLVDGSFFNSGQSCCGIERIYVDQKIHDDFVEGFVNLTNQYNLGNPLKQETDLGPMVRIKSAEDARKQISRAVEMGAQPLIDIAQFPQAKKGSPYMVPQVLVNVNHDMEIMQDETFAPVVGIMPVKNDEEAIRLMNDSTYGLTASVWSQDLDACLAIGDRIETGTFFMNRCDYLDPALAWTGVKNSGRGVSLSNLGFHELTRPKSFHLKS